MLYILPIVFIAGIFIVFYLFKDKFMAGTMKDYNEANQKWAESKSNVIAELYSNPNEFQLVHNAVGKNIDCIVNCEVKKGIGSKLLKGLKEVATLTETFDMGLCYLAITGDEMHFLQSNGETIVDHSVFDLKALQGVEISRDSTAMKAIKHIATDRPGTNDKFYTLSFACDREEYSFKVNESNLQFAKFTIDKAIVVDRKYGHNPYTRMFTVENSDLHLLNMYSAEIIPQFTAKMESLAR